MYRKNISSGHQLLSEVNKFDLVKRLREEISKLKVRRAVLKLDFLINNKLLKESQLNLIVLRVSDVLDTRVCLGDARCIILCDLQRAV